MILNCGDLKLILARFALDRDCNPINGDLLRVSTPFLYPDGSNVDLFLEHRSLGGLLLSDLGETCSYLYAHSITVDGGRKRQIAASITQTLRVELVRGQLQVWTNNDKLPDDVCRVAQACIRIADLVYMPHTAVNKSFRDKVIETIEQTRLPFEAPAQLPGRFGKTVNFDANVGGPKPSLIKMLSDAALHGIMVEAFRCWYDLENYRNRSRFITVIDERARVRDDDVERLAQVSTVVKFPSHQNNFKDLLLTAS